MLGILEQTFVYYKAEHYLATQTMSIDKPIIVGGEACPDDGECWYGEVDLGEFE